MTNYLLISIQFKISLEHFFICQAKLTRAHQWTFVGHTCFFFYNVFKIQSRGFYLFRDLLHQTFYL